MRAETEGRGVFDSIYEANIETIYLTAKRYTRNHHAAEEIAQDTFLKLFRNMEHTNIEAAKPWLILTAKYAAMNWRRDTAREYLVAEFTEEEERRISESVEDPEEILIRRLKEKEFTELTGDIFAALYCKNQRWYDAITIVYVLEKPQKEVAETMGMDLESFHSMLYRAKQWIREKYKERYDKLQGE